MPLLLTSALLLPPVLLRTHFHSYSIHTNLHFFITNFCSASGVAPNLAHWNGPLITVPPRIPNSCGKNKEESNCFFFFSLFVFFFLFLFKNCKKYQTWGKYKEESHAFDLTQHIILTWVRLFRWFALGWFRECHCSHLLLHPHVLYGTVQVSPTAALLGSGRGRSLTAHPLLHPPVQPSSAWRASRSLTQLFLISHRNAFSYQQAHKQTTQCHWQNDYSGMTEWISIVTSKWG